MSCKHTIKKRCQLCEAIEKGKPLSKVATQLLNAQHKEPIPPTRECPRCKQEAEELVSRGSDRLCVPCAEELDADDT